ncbi:mitochondrial genome maintenance MGM101 [Amylocystis lapponica]|nr:mitochondrial genome maintenance MGM101 [Amylocystis lapponica]
MASRLILARLAPAAPLRRVSARSYAALRPSAPRPANASTAARPLTTEPVVEPVTDADIADLLSTPPESVPSSSVLQPAEPALASLDTTSTDWSKSYSGLSQQPFPRDAADVLLAPVAPLDVEIKPDGLIYLPEIKYRRVLNKAFGPGGWGLAPRSETNVGPRVVSREYALVCLGRLVAIARGEQEYFDPNGVPTATEACKSNALMRCCKDLGIASELWDPRFIREFKAKYCVEVFAEHMSTKKKKKLWRRKDQPKFDYPWKE